MREYFHLQICIVVSLLLHVVAIGTWQGREFLARLPFIRPLVKLMEKAADSRTIYTMDTTRTKPPMETITFVELPEPERAPHTFMETAPSQVTGEQPKHADFYSDKATVAANQENPTKKNAETPFLKGEETRFLSPENVSPKSDPTPPPTPAITPLPAAPKPPAPPPEPPKPPAPAVPPPPPEPPKQEIPEEGQKVEEVKKPVETKVAQAASPEVPFPLSPASAVPAIAMPTPGGPPDSGREMGGAKSKITAAGVSRTGVNAFNVASSPFGEYDKKLIRAVQSRWYALIERYGIYERTGEVTVYFQLFDDGTVHAMAVPKNSAGEILALYCQKAIVDSAPFDPLPEDLRRLIGKDPREVNFTFYY